MMVTDELNLRLLAELERSPRCTGSDLALRLGTSANTVRRRLQRLIDERAVRVVAVPSPAAIGYRVQAAIGLNVRSGQHETAADQLSTYPQIQHVLLTTGLYDIIIFPIARDLDHLHDFVRLCLGQVAPITSHETMVIMKTIKASLSLLTDPPKNNEFRVEPRRMDDTDLRLIRELEHNARASIQEIAERMGVSRSTVSHRQRRLLEGKAIRIVTVVNPRFLGLGTNAMFLIRVDPAKIDDVAEGVLGFRECRHIATVAGRYDIIAFAVVRDSQALAEFRDKLLDIPGVASVDAVINQLFAKNSFSLLTLRDQERAEPGIIPLRA